MSEYLTFRIQNFQSIKDQVFEFKSLTSIVGPTDRGKSAIKRALEALFYNEWEDEYLRKYTKKCTLTATFPDGYLLKEVIREKTKSANSYTFKFSDGRKDKYIPKAGVQIPDELKMMGFDIIETERKDKFNLNFQGQYDPLFLVAQSKPLVTSFFNRIFKITKYERALKRLTADIIKLKGEYDDNEVKLENKVNELDQVEGKFREVSNHLDYVKELVRQYDECASQIKDYEVGIEKLNRMVLIKNESDKLKDNLIYINDLINQLDIYSNYLNNISYLTDKVSQIVTLNCDINRLYILNHSLKQGAQLVTDYLEGFREYGVILNDIDNIFSLECAVSRWLDLVNDLNNVGGVLNDYHLSIQDLLTFLTYTDRLTALSLYLGGLNRRINEYDYLIKQVEPLLADQEDILSLAGYYPQLCSKKLLISGLEVGVKELVCAGDIIENLLNNFDDLILLVGYSNRLYKLWGDLRVCEVNSDSINDTLSQLNRYNSSIKVIIKLCPTCDRPWEEYYEFNTKNNAFD